MNKRFISFILTIAMLLGCFSTAFASTSNPRIADPGKIVPVLTDPVQGGNGFGEIEGSKTAEEIGEGEYEITVSVPGVDTEVNPDEKLYNELIVMIDGSDSQSSNIGKLKETIKKIGSKVLTDDGRTHLTLMGFGYSAKTVDSYSTYSELVAKLDEIDQDSFLYGVSATNCEVGFNWINDYVKNSKNLNEAVVVFSSDGETNLDEEPWDWSMMYDADTLHWKDKTGSFLVENIGIPVQEECVLNNDAPLLDASLTLIAKYAPEMSVDTTSSGAIKAISALIADHPKEWVENLLTDMFAAKGLVYGPDCKISASAFEHILWDYVRDLGHGYELRSDGLADLFLCLILDMGTQMTDYYAGRGNDEFGSRAADACDNLGANEKVKNIYLIGYKYHDGKEPVNHWMNPASSVDARITTEKAIFTESKNFDGVIDLLQGEVLETIVKMPVNDPVVTDPMSKWVTLDEDSIAVLCDGEIIWTATDGWLIPENDRPVSGEPVDVTIDRATGRPVISWAIKDGALVITDRYALTYTVTMNTEAEGYIPGTDYPLNDPTDVTYKNEDQELVKVDIKVPEGRTPGQKVTVNYYISGTETKLEDSVETAPAPKYSEYDVTGSHLDTITKDGKTYVLVYASGDPEEGTLDGDKVVNLYYVEQTTVVSRPVVTGGVTEEPEDEVKEEVLSEAQPADEPEEPAEEVEDVVEDIEDGETPLSEAPVTEEELEEMPEEDVPLADVPATGENTIWAIVALVSACLMMMAVIFDRKRRAE